MTRINCVEPSELTNKHLMGEIHEITRVYSLARKATTKYHNSTEWAFHKKPPANYVLGTGHVLFHMDKLSYIYNRYSSLCSEARSRGYNVNQISEESLSQGIDKTFFRGYNPTHEAIEINRQRISDRLRQTKPTLEETND